MILISPDKYNQLTEDSTDNQQMEPLDVDVILSAIPKNFRNRAKSLLTHIMADTAHTLQWNERGELLYRGTLIPGSHITDLLKNSQRHYRHLQPIGQKEFRKGLQELNVPLGLLETGPPGIPKDEPTWVNV